MAVLAVALMIAPAPAPAQDGGFDVTVRRTAHGIPHIEARDFAGIGYGYGYSFAQDNLCVIADSVRDGAAASARGSSDPTRTWRFQGNTSLNNNLDSDFFFKRIIDNRVVERLIDRPAPQGPLPGVRELVRGYTAGYNRYLRDTGVDRLPDPSCRGAAWVRPITGDRRLPAHLPARAGRVGHRRHRGDRRQPSRRRPAPSRPARAPTAPSRAEVDALRSTVAGLGAGSNAYGLGREATDNGKGMLLGNPHFPWDGSERFYQAHLTIPGKLDVSGASLYGVPLTLIGHTRGLAWSHTVSPAFRFTPFELKLVPGSPTTYLVDGQPREMKRDQVTVQARTARRLARAPQPHAVLDGVRADVHLHSRTGAVSLGAGPGLRDGRRERRQLPLSEPLLRDQPRSEHPRVRRDPPPQPGDPLRPLDSGGLRRGGLLRGPVRGAPCDQREGERVQHARSAARCSPRRACPCSTGRARRATGAPTRAP
ncbi:MAG: penicillin acylase family protein [Thermoleophilaceae bacterium]